MQQPVAAPGETTAIELVLHQRDRVAQAGDLRLLHVLRGVRGLRGKTALDPLTRRIERQRVDARAHAYLDQAFDLGHDQRLAHRRPRDAELQRPFALGRQLRAGRVFAALEQSAQLVGDLGLEAARLDGLDRHANLRKRAGQVA